MDSSFLGQGWRFPVNVNPITGEILYSQHEQDISESIRIIIGTAPGERVMRPEFGCGIHSYVFGNMDVSTLTLITGSVKDALTRWEPRITVIDVNAVPDSDSGKLTININYEVRSTNTRNNLVYDFFIKEAR